MPSQSTRWRIWLCLPEVAGLLAALLYAVSCLGWHDGLPVTAALAIAYSLPVLLHSRTQGASPWGRMVLMVVGLLMVGGAINSLDMWCSPQGHSLEWPWLNHDDGGYYRWARHYYDGACAAPQVAFPGLPVAILLLWKLLGVNITWPLAMNLSLTIIAIVLTGQVTRCLLSGRTNRSDRWLVTAGMVGAAVLMYFISQGLRIQKEAMVYFSMALTGLVLAAVARDRIVTRLDQIKAVALATLAFVVLTFARTTYMYFVLLGVVMVFAAHARKHWHLGLLLVVIWGLAFWVGNSVAYYSLERHFVISGGGEAMSKAFVLGSAQQPYVELMGDYFNYPVWNRLLHLPLAAAVQFVIPFPWVYHEWSFTNILPRVAFGWYAVGGLALFYYAAMSWQRDVSLGVWAWWPALTFVLVAYVTGGTVSRYVLPVEPMFVPLALWVIEVARGDRRWRRALLWWLAGYLVVLVVTLVCCYRAQTDYLQRLDEFYRNFSGQ